MYLGEAYLLLPKIFQGFNQQITSIVYLEKKEEHTKQLSVNKGSDLSFLVTKALPRNTSTCKM